MKRLLNRSRLIWLVILAFTSAVVLSSCDKEELEIQQNYPFEVRVMPVPGEVASGQTVEIRITIERNGNFNDTEYYIRYFQFDGQGTLQYFSEPPYLPNDLYQLPATQFRMYYTSQATVTQSFDVWVSDNFGNERQVSFQFNSAD
ncbi:DUF3872 domain-containing protein [Zunongwangia pacifica]|uniref:DUF3872 domain-containing protein n=1 Tax=Zunongwangia pacifica TaxID=2911062 RepID=A0A9X2CNG2_9FLAO|nr:DUF3872 domain-containing protein [Zunongwangia pacifica]MCL6216902.1 DUF3872 domain-containing protein [Zunongwangia pacifica]